jgi:hypothetical protein
MLRGRQFARDRKKGLIEMALQPHALSMQPIDHHVNRDQHNGETRGPGQPGGYLIAEVEVCAGLLPQHERKRAQQPCQRKAQD